MKFEGFYLGTHIPKWVSELRGVPLFLSRMTLRAIRTLWRATTRWGYDSGAFSEITKHGRWPITEDQFLDESLRIFDGVGMPDFAAPMDWMCEDHVLEVTGLTVIEHQWRTVDSYCSLARRAPFVPWIPVLQGQTPADYVACARMYERNGIDLANAPLIGIGSVCRRQKTREIIDVLSALPPYRYHGFGVKLTGIRHAGQYLETADSLAWSFAARTEPPIPGHSHKNCANCLEYALNWRMKVAQAIEDNWETSAR